MSFYYFAGCNILKVGRKLLAVWEVPEITCLRMVCQASRTRGREGHSSAQGHHLPSPVFRPVGCIRHRTVPPCSLPYHLHRPSPLFQLLVSIINISLLWLIDQLRLDKSVNYHSFSSHIQKFRQHSEVVCVSDAINLYVKKNPLLSDLL